MKLGSAAKTKIATGIRKPAAFRIASEDARTARTKRRAISPSRIKLEPDEPQGELVVIPPAPLPAPQTLRWGAILITTLAGLFAIWAGLSITQLIEELFARSQILGSIGLGLAGLAGFAALAIVIREIWWLVRLNRI